MERSLNHNHIQSEFKHIGQPFVWSTLATGKYFINSLIFHTATLLSSCTSYILSLSLQKQSGEYPILVKFNGIYILSIHPFFICLLAGSFSCWIKSGSHAIIFKGVNISFSLNTLKIYLPYIPLYGTLGLHQCDRGLRICVTCGRAEGSLPTIQNKLYVNRSLNLISLFCLQGLVANILPVLFAKVKPSNSQVHHGLLAYKYIMVIDVVTVNVVAYC